MDEGGGVSHLIDIRRSKHAALSRAVLDRVKRVLFKIILVAF